MLRRKSIIAMILLVGPLATYAQGIDFMASQRGRQQADHENYVDYLRQYNPNAAMYEEQIWQQQEYQRQMLEQQRLQSELQRQQLRQLQYGPSHTTTTCYTDPSGVLRCTTR